MLSQTAHILARCSVLVVQTCKMHSFILKPPSLKTYDRGSEAALSTVYQSTGRRTKKGVKPRMRSQGHSRSPEEPGPHTSSKFSQRSVAAMALLLSVASAATSLVAAAPCPARPTASWRHSELGFSAPPCGRIPKIPAGRCRAQAEAAEAAEAAETAASGAERPLWLPGSTPPPYLDGT